MAKKKVYVCFDYEKDKEYKNLLMAWDANPSFEFSFNDYSSGEIKSNNISVVKSSLTRKIKQATYTLVLAGQDINKKHRDSTEIGCCNWQNFEIARNIENKKKLVVVKMNDYGGKPQEIIGYKDVVWVQSFKEQEIIDGLNEAMCL